MIADMTVKEFERWLKASPKWKLHLHVFFIEVSLAQLNPASPVEAMQRVILAERLVEIEKEIIYRV